MPEAPDPDRSETPDAGNGRPRRACLALSTGTLRRNPTLCEHRGTLELFSSEPGVRGPDEFEAARSRPIRKWQERLPESPRGRPAIRPPARGAEPEPGTRRPHNGAGPATDHPWSRGAGPGCDRGHGNDRERDRERDRVHDARNESHRRDGAPAADRPRNAGNIRGRRGYATTRRAYWRTGSSPGRPTPKFAEEVTFTKPERVRSRRLALLIRV